MSLFSKLKRMYDENKLEKLERKMQGHAEARAQLKVKQLRNVAKYEALHARLKSPAGAASAVISPTGLGLKSKGNQR